MQQIQQWLSTVGLSTEQWLVAIAGTVLTLLLMGLLRYRSKHVKWRIRRTIKKLGAEYLENLRIPDGMDGYLYIDYVVLTQSGLKLVSVKHFDGLIYGGEYLEFWRQVTGSGSYQFPNPLKELDMKAQALKTLLPDVDTDQLVLFEGRNSFPKAMPENVVRLKEFSNVKPTIPVDDRLKSSWQRVCELS